MTERVAECRYPEANSCKGCSWSYNSALYDGGCMLHYENSRGEKNPQTKEDGITGGELHTKKFYFKRVI